MLLHKNTNQNWTNKIKTILKNRRILFSSLKWCRLITETSSNVDLICLRVSEGSTGLDLDLLLQVQMERLSLQMELTPPRGSCDPVGGARHSTELSDLQARVWRSCRWWRWRASLHYGWVFCSSFQTWWAPPSGFCPISQHAALPDMEHQCLTQDFSLLCH